MKKSVLVTIGVVAAVPPVLLEVLEINSNKRVDNNLKVTIDRNISLGDFENPFIDVEDNKEALNEPKGIIGNVTHYYKRSDKKETIDIYLDNNGIKLKKNDNPIILENMHEPIIDRETFLKANSKIKIIKKTSQEIFDKLLSDIIRTSNDRKVYYGFKVTNKNTNKRNEYYENKKDNILIRIDYLHKVLYEYCISYVKNILKNKEKFKKDILKYLIENSNHEKRIKQINSELSEIENLFSKIFEQYAFEEISFDEYEEKRILYSNKQVLLTKEKEELLNDNETVYEINKRVELFVDSISKKTLKMSEVDLIRLCIKKVIVKRINKDYDIKIIDVFSK